MQFSASGMKSNCTAPARVRSSHGGVLWRSSTAPKLAVHAHAMQPAHLHTGVYPCELAPTDRRTRAFRLPGRRLSVCSRYQPDEAAEWTQTVGVSYDDCIMLQGGSHRCCRFEEPSALLRVPAAAEGSVHVTAATSVCSR